MKDTINCYCKVSLAIQCINAKRCEDHAERKMDKMVFNYLKAYLQALCEEKYFLLFKSSVNHVQVLQN